MPHVGLTVFPVSDAVYLARDVAQRLGAIKGIVAVALEGATASEEVNPDADLELSIYYRNDQRPDVADLREVAYSLNSSLSADAVTDFDVVAPLSSSGAWLWVEGQRMEWRYQDLAHVLTQIEACRRGIVTGRYQPGYPQGFFTHYVAGSVNQCQPLYDPAGILRDLKRLTETYPKPLKTTLIKAFGREADLVLFAAQRAIAEGDVFHAVGCLHRCVASLVQVLFAVNEEYMVHERGSVEGVMRLPNHPQDFSEAVGSILGHAGETEDSVQDRIAELRALLSQIQLEYVMPLDLDL